MTSTVGILGATGPVGGELARLVVQHPDLELAWASSREHAQRPLASVHPHLSGATRCRFSEPEPVPELDALLCATPHGITAPLVDELTEAADHVVDLSSDFRLDDPDTYEATYGREHPSPQLLAEVPYGLPELDREGIESAPLVAGPGCLATASILALAPIARADLLDGVPVVDAKIGSTAAGHAGGRWSSHAARQGTVRPYAPAGHRHEPEIQAATGIDDLRFSAHAVDMTRGVLATVHVPTPADRKQLRRALLEAYGSEPFVDVLPGRAGPGGVPEPRFVAGTNRAQVAAVTREGEGEGAVVLCAIDNLGKGAAGTAIQILNARLGHPETRGLEARAAFP